MPSRRKLLTTLSVMSFIPAHLPTQWVSPVINSVLLPIHAQNTLIPRGPEIGVENVTCIQGSPSSVTFDLCNLENEAVTVTAIAPGIDDFAIHISPTLPIVIQPNSCVSFTAQGATPPRCSRSAHP